MKKNILPMWVIILLLLFSSANSFADDVLPEAEYFKPENTSNRIIKYGDKYAHSILRPAGWSADGKFAFVNEQVVGGRGGVKFSYIIFDAVEDSIVETIKDDSFNWENRIDKENAGKEGYYFTISYGKNKESWNTLLTKYAIDSTHPPLLEQFPLLAGGIEYAPEFEFTYRDKEDPYYSFTGSISGLKVSLKKDNLIKKIYSNQELQSWNCWSGGYFYSPFEKRILIVIGTETPSSEGSYILTGSHLQYGF